MYQKVVSTGFLVHEQKNAYHLSPAHDEYRWVTADEIEEYPISPEIKESFMKGHFSYPA